MNHKQPGPSAAPVSRYTWWNKRSCEVAVALLCFVGTFYHLVSSFSYPFVHVSAVSDLFWQAVQSEQTFCIVASLYDLFKLAMHGNSSTSNSMSRINSNKQQQQEKEQTKHNHRTNFL
jgi:hypothetical protein